MKRFCLLILFFFLFCPSAWGQKTLYYETINKKTGKLVEQSRITIQKRDNNGVHLYFERGFPGYPQKEEYILNKDYETLSWQVRNPQTQTDYKGIKIEQRVIIEGTLNGVDISREYELGKTPLLAFPKFEMSPFVLSENEEKITFWALRDDTLEIFKMIAWKKDDERITVNDEEITARKVYWTTKNPLFRLFQRTYYFRPEDGLFIKQEYSDGRVRELIAEQ